MNLRTTLAALCLIGGLPFATAQHSLIKDHELGAVPTVPDKVKAGGPGTILLRRTVVSNLVEEDDDMVEYYLVHHSIFLRDAAAIESENKVSVNLSSTIDVVEVKARSIAPDGKVQELGEDAFKRAKDEEDGGNYLYFAFEGLVPGSVIDYYHVTKRKPNMRGDSETLQLSVPIVKEDVHLINPARLVYKAKSYQGVPEATIDSSDADLQHMRWEMNDVPELENEESANMGAARMRISYKLDRVPDRGIKDFSGYIGASKMYHDVVHQELDGKAQKGIASLIKEMDIDKKGSEEDRVRAAEDYLKTHFQVVEFSAPELLQIESILKNKVCSELGMMSLTCAVLRDLGIEYQIVVTSDRTRVPFDKDFESFQFLDDMALYLPTLKKYMAPSLAGIRLGYMQSENMANYGLFIKNFDLGGTVTGVGSVKYIEPLPDTATEHDHIITADLSGGPEQCALTFENRLTGFYAPIQCFWALMDEDQRAEAQNEYVKYLVENGEVGSLTVENGESKLHGVQPFIIKGKVNTSRFSASAGDKMLFKIGELIGPQVQMYAEKPRKLPVDDDYNRRFGRTIDVILPAGWTVQNINDLNMDIHLDVDGERKLAFESKATMVGNTLQVRVNEYYKICQVPLERFEEYRSVVNAAADFNKLALVLVKN